MKQLKLFEFELDKSEMSEIPFPPDLKPGRKGGHLERVYVCPQCGAVKFLAYEVDEIIYGRGNSWRQARDCFDVACQYCKHQFKLMTSRSKCEHCSARTECLLHGTAEIITRRMYKPYSTIKPRRMTVWE